MLHRLRLTKGSPKVADEAMFAEAERDGFARQINRGRSRFCRVVYNIICAPISVLSCFSMKQGNGSDRFWVTGETMRVSEIDHLMVRDSMRYAILM